MTSVMRVSESMSRRKMDVVSVSRERFGRESSDRSAQSCRFVKEHVSGQTLSVEPPSRWANEQANQRVDSLESTRSDRFESPSWSASMRQIEPQPATMSIQFGAQQHQHHHSHSHLHYYATADMQLRSEAASSQDLNYYRSYHDQYYANQHPQQTDACRYQSNAVTVDHETNYSVAGQELSAGPSEYQHPAIYGQKSGPYCQQHRTYQAQSSMSDPVTQEPHSSYQYQPSNHLHQQHQNYGSSSNNIESVAHHPSRSQANMTMDIVLTNNIGHARSLDHAGNHYSHSSPAGCRDYYTRQYSNSGSYHQYPRQEQYMQIISQNHPITIDEYQAEQRLQQSSRPSESIHSGGECSASAVVLIAKPKREQSPPLKKRVRDSNTRRQVAVDNQCKNSVQSCKGSNSQGDLKQSSKTNQCHICNRHYARPSTLKTHLRTHTNERPYKCSVCCKTFSQAANLTAHQRVHTGERPFPCPICGRQFSQSSSVITHLRTHSGERPYRCNMCHRTFSDSSTLTKHCRIHSGEKPYQCEYCQLNFSQSGNLSRHIRLHLLNGLRNPLRVSTPASDTLLQPRQGTTTGASSSVSIPASFSSSSSSNSSSSTSTTSF